MNPYIIGGGGAAIVVLFLMLLGANKRVGELETKLDKQAQETQECADANDTNDQTIDQLEGEIERLVNLRAADAEERERVLAERSRELERAQARADELERLRDTEIATNEDCATFNELVVGEFCPATADSLRRRSRSPGGD